MITRPSTTMRILHYKFSETWTLGFLGFLGFLALIPFFTGLFLFGLVLTLRRILDKGSLWGCIGLHGGLVGIWYLFDSGMVVFSLETPYYFLGPSEHMVIPMEFIV